MTLREIDAAILACIDPETGEVDAEQLEALQMERDAKIKGVAEWIIDLDGDVAKIDAEIKRLTKLKTAAEKKIDSLKGFLRFALLDTPYKGDTFQVTFRRSRSVADMTDEQIINLPPEFRIYKQTIKPDKKAIKKAIDEGWNIAGVLIIENVSVGVK